MIPCSQTPVVTYVIKCSIIFSNGSIRPSSPIFKYYQRSIHTKLLELYQKLHIRHRFDTRCYLQCDKEFCFQTVFNDVEATSNKIHQESTSRRTLEPNRRENSQGNSVINWDSTPFASPIFIRRR